MKIAIAQQNYSVGDFGKNATKISKAIFEAKSQKADLVVFPEMSVCGSFPFDVLQKEDFLETTMQVLQRIATESYEIAVLIGCPTYCEDENETKVYDSAILIENGIITRRFNKKNLSHLESKYFLTDTEKNFFEWKNQKIAVCVGDDVPEEENGISLAINITAKQFKYKDSHFSDQFSKTQYPVICVNQVGANTERVFEGHSFVLNKNGEKILQLPYFTEDFVIFDTDKNYEPLAKEECNEIGLLHDALILGIQDYFLKMVSRLQHSDFRAELTQPWYLPLLPKQLEVRTLGFYSFLRSIQHRIPSPMPKVWQKILAYNMTLFP